jgi:HSP20 family molecular chaperone IbpA
LLEGDGSEYCKGEKGKVKISLPGYGKEDVTLSIEGSYLVVKTKDGKHERSLKLSSRVDTDGISAEMRHGLLMISLPEKSVSKGIEIK